MLSLALTALLVVAPAQEAWTRAEMTADLEQLVGAVREQWAYLEDRTVNNGLELEALHTRSLAALDDVHSRTDFADVLRRFVAALEDGHGSVAIVTGEPQRVYLLLDLVPCAEGLVVVAAGEDTTVARAPQRGDLLLAIDGRTVTDLIAELELVTVSSTPGQRRASAIKALIHSTASEVELELEDPLGERHLVRVRTRAWPLMPEPDNWGLAWPRADVALLRIESFAVKDWSAWMQAEPEEREPFLTATYERIAEIFAELDGAGARALIIDVRGNGGGTDLLGQRVLAHLIGESFVYYQLSALGDEGWRAPWGRRYETEPGTRVFDGRVLALTDAGCFSATDNFLRALRVQHPDFGTVGRASGGGTGAPRNIVTLEHSSARISLCTMRVLGPAGELIEGRGTLPDLAVTWTRADVLAGRDPDLEAALRALDE